MAPSPPIILVITNSNDATASFFLEKAQPQKSQLVRLDTDQFQMNSICYSQNDYSSHWQMQIQDTTIDQNNLGAIYFRRPRPPSLTGISDPAILAWTQNEFRSAWGGILMQIPADRWMDFPLRVSRAGYKIDQLETAKALGFQIPKSLLTSEPKRAFDFCEECSWRVVAKPIGHGEVRSSAEDVSHILYTNALKKEKFSAFDMVANCPVLFQELIQKRYDIRVTVVGEQCTAIILHSQDQEISQSLITSQNPKKTIWWFPIVLFPLKEEDWENEKEIWS